MSFSEILLKYIICCFILLFMIYFYTITNFAITKIIGYPCGHFEILRNIFFFLVFQRINKLFNVV